MTYVGPMNGSGIHTIDITEFRECEADLEGEIRLVAVLVDEYGGEEHEISLAPDDTADHRQHLYYFTCPFAAEVDILVDDTGTTGSWTCPTCGTTHSEDRDPIGEPDPDEAYERMREDRDGF